MYDNIEHYTKRGRGYRVGYDRHGFAVKIYGNSRHGYIVCGRYRRTLREISAFLKGQTAHRRGDEDANV